VSEIDDEYNPRKTMRLLLLDNEEVLKSDEIWKCNQCHACVAHCPQDVRFADVVRSLREEAIEKGYRKKELLDSVLEYDLELRKERLEKVKQALK
jgi:heterodisulfide reductase subunit C